MATKTNKTFGNANQTINEGANETIAVGNGNDTVSAGAPAWPIVNSSKGLGAVPTALFAQGPTGEKDGDHFIYYAG